MVQESSETFEKSVTLQVILGGPFRAAGMSAKISQASQTTCFDPAPPCDPNEEKGHPKDRRHGLSPVMETPGTLAAILRFGPTLRIQLDVIVCFSQLQNGTP